MSVAPFRLPPPVQGLRDTLTSWLHPGPGKGLQTSERVPSEARLESTRQTGGVRVLVVDDDPLIRLVISAQIQSRGLVLMLAEDGAEAVSLVRKMHFDLILMDLQMPILGGFEATAAIRRFEILCARPAAPIVAYSSTAPCADLLATHCMNDSLTKPCDEQGLEDCLVKWCPTYRSARIGAVTPS